MIPIQYSGAEYVNRLKLSRLSSVRLPRLIAAFTPIHAPSRVAISVPVPTNSSVHGIAALISSQTGSRVSWLMPSSNVSVSPT